MAVFLILVIPNKPHFYKLLKINIMYEVNVKFHGSCGWQMVCKCATKAEAEAEIEHQRTIEDEGDCEYEIVETKIEKV